MGSHNMAIFSTRRLVFVWTWNEVRSSLGHGPSILRTAPPASFQLTRELPANSRGADDSPPAELRSRTKLCFDFHAPNWIAMSYS